MGEAQLNDEEHDPPLARPKASLIDIINNHPISLLAAVIISSVSATVGVVTFYNTQQNSSIEERHKAEMAALATKNLDGLATSSRKYQQEISDLSSRITSIERRIPGSGPTYMDVSSISIGPEAQKALGKEYKEFDNGNFLVNAPASDDWYFEITDEARLAKEMLGVELGDSSLANVMSMGQLYAWKNKNVFKVRLPDAGLLGRDHVFTFRPAIYVIAIDYDFIRNRLASLQNAMSDTDSTEKELNAQIKDTATTLDELSNKTNLPAADAAASSTGEKTSDIQAQPANLISDATEAKDKALDDLNEIFTSDLSSAMLSDIFASTTLQSMYTGFTNRIYSVQKKGNVFYLQNQMIFKNCALLVDGKFGDATNRAIVDQEIFYIGNGTKGYLIKIFLPPIDSKAEAFIWTKSWLAGLQIPLY
jgi:prefoldin subunit 5